MRDRLIELINNYPCMSTAEDCFMESISDDLADYLLENGVIVAPCKVGDKVYYISSRYEKRGRRNVHVYFVEEGEVDSITVGDSGIPQIEVSNGENEWSLFDSEEDFGVIVFSTREEAEQALKEGAE